MKEIIDHLSFAVACGWCLNALEGVPNLNYKPTAAHSGAKRLTRHWSIATHHQWMFLRVTSYNNAMMEPEND